MNRLLVRAILVSSIAAAGCSDGANAPTRPPVGARTTKGTVPMAAATKVKQVKAVTKLGKSTVAPVTNGAFSLELPQDKFVIVFIGTDGKPVASVEYPTQAGKPISYVSAGAFMSDAVFDFGVINIDFTTHIAIATTNIYTFIDGDGDGTPDFSDDDDDGDGTLDASDNDDDDDGIDDSQDDLDADGDGICDIADPDDDGDGVVDALDTDDDGDGVDDEVDQDADGDGIADDQDTDDDNDGTDDGADTDDNGDGVDDGSQDQDGDGTPDYEDDDQDGDGQSDEVDMDDDNDGIPDTEDS